MHRLAVQGYWVLVEQRYDNNLLASVYVGGLALRNLDLDKVDPSPDI